MFRTFEATQPWTSKRTFHAYPTSWRLRAPSIGLDLAIDAAFDDQELITVISKPAFWEGRCQARGVLGGHAVAGNAYIERSGFENIQTLDEFFSAVGVEVRKSTAAVLPYEPTHDEMRDLIIQHASTQVLRHEAKKRGMRTLRQCGLLAIYDGVTTIEEVVRETIVEE